MFTDLSVTLTFSVADPVGGSDKSGSAPWSVQNDGKCNFENVAAGGNISANNLTANTSIICGNNIPADQKPTTGIASWNGPLQSWTGSGGGLKINGKWGATG